MSRMRIGPGSLVFGEVGSEEEFEAQILEAVVEPSVKAEEDEEVLSGDIIPGEEDYTAVLKGNLNQDITTTGINRWSWEHKGEVMPFVYTPNSAVEGQVTGEVKIRPIAVGGKVGERAKADFEFPCVGFPDLQDIP